MLLKTGILGIFFVLFFLLFDALHTNNLRNSIVLVGLMIFAMVGLFWTLDCDPLLFVLPFHSKKKYFNGKVIWIVGASSGIGASLAKDLSAGGAQLIISARREEKLKEVAEECGRVGLKPAIFPLDIVDEDMQKCVFQQIMDQYGKVDTLILNSGKSQRATAVNLDMKATTDLMKLNFFSYVALSKIVLPSMLGRKNGMIVVMSSLSGKIGTPVASSYSASKFALHGYFDALRSEVSCSGIDILVVCPGPVQSELASHFVTAENVQYGANESNDKKQPTSRCTFLISKAMAYKFEEIWISSQPFLALAYFNMFFPWAGRQLSKKIIGPARVKALELGGDVFNNNMFRKT